MALCPMGVTSMSRRLKVFHGTKAGECRTSCTEGFDLAVNFMPMGNCIMQSSVMNGTMASPDFVRARHVASSRSVIRVKSSSDAMELCTIQVVGDEVKVRS